MRVNPIICLACTLTNSVNTSRFIPQHYDDTGFNFKEPIYCLIIYILIFFMGKGRGQLVDDILTLIQESLEYPNATTIE